MMSEDKNGMKLTEEHRKKIGKSRRGMKFTQEHKRNMRRAKASASDLIIKTPHGDYPSFNEAGRQTGISYKTIFNRCRNPSPKWKEWQVISKEQDEEKKLEEWKVSFFKRKEAAYQKRLEDMIKELEGGQKFRRKEREEEP